MISLGLQNVSMAMDDVEPGTAVVITNCSVGCSSDASRSRWFEVTCNSIHAMLLHSQHTHAKMVTTMRSEVGDPLLVQNAEEIIF